MPRSANLTAARLRQHINPKDTGDRLRQVQVRLAGSTLDPTWEPRLRSQGTLILGAALQGNLRGAENSHSQLPALLIQAKHL